MKTETMYLLLCINDTPFPCCFLEFHNTLMYTATCITLCSFHYQSGKVGNRADDNNVY